MAETSVKRGVSGDKIELTINLTKSQYARLCVLVKSAVDSRKVCGAWAEGDGDVLIAVVNLFNQAMVKTLDKLDGEIA